MTISPPGVAAAPAYLRSRTTDNLTSFNFEANHEAASASKKSAWLIRRQISVTIVIAGSLTSLLAALHLVQSSGGVASGRLTLF